MGRAPVRRRRATRRACRRVCARTPGRRRAPPSRPGQPAAGQGGTWSIDPTSGALGRVRPQWGYYVAQGTLLATARPAQRDTYVQHLPSGREWTLATTNSTTFSPDGTVVAYATAAAGQPG